MKLTATSKACYAHSIANFMIRHGCDSFREIEDPKEPFPQKLSGKIQYFDDCVEVINLAEAMVSHDKYNETV